MHIENKNVFPSQVLASVKFPDRMKEANELWEHLEVNLASCICCLK